MLCLLLQACLFQQAVESPWRKFIAQIPRNCHATRFLCVLELPMTPFRLHVVPAILLDHLDRFTNLHPTERILRPRAFREWRAVNRWPVICLHAALTTMARSQRSLTA